MADDWLPKERIDRLAQRRGEKGTLARMVQRLAAQNQAQYDLIATLREQLVEEA